MRILVVEDEHSSLQELGRMLEEQPDIEFRLFSDPSEALEASEHSVFDGALMDIQMPGMTGLDLAERLQEHQPGIRIVFLTAFNHYATEAFELSATDYLLKPVRPARFARALERMRSGLPARPAAGTEACVEVLGSFRLLHGAEEVPWDRSKTRELFAYLLLHRDRRVHKETICEQLWPDFEMSRALVNLQVTMCRLRKTLSPFGRDTVRIEFRGDHYIMRCRSVRIDAGDFQTLAESATPGGWERAMDLYQGEFLEGMEWLWAEPERERLRRIYERVVVNRARQALEGGETERAEAILEHHLKTRCPGESAAALYFQVLAQGKSRYRMARAYQEIREYFREELDAGFSRELEGEYRALWNQMSGE